MCSEKPTLDTEKFHNHSALFIVKDALGCSLSSMECLLFLAEGVVQTNLHDMAVQCLLILSHTRRLPIDLCCIPSCIYLYTSWWHVFRVTGYAHVDRLRDKFLSFWKGSRAKSQDLTIYGIYDLPDQTGREVSGSLQDAYVIAEYKTEGAEDFCHFWRKRLRPEGLSTPTRWWRPRARNGRDWRVTLHFYSVRMTTRSLLFLLNCLPCLS